MSPSNVFFDYKIFIFPIYEPTMAANESPIPRTTNLSKYNTYCYIYI
jgi:hypothetical protein